MRFALFALWMAACSRPLPPATPTCPEAPVTAVAATPSTSIPTVPAFDDAQVIAQSQAFVSALDRYDAAAFDGLIDAAFVNFAGGRTYDAATVRRRIAMQLEHKVPPQTRRCNEPRVLRGETAVTFVHRCAITIPAHGDVPTLEHSDYDSIIWTPSASDWKVVYYAKAPSGVEAERQGWNDTFRTGVHFKTTPNQHLIDTVKGRKPGKAVDVAMGQGRNALHLAAQGWKVTGVDISDEGIKIAQANAAKQKLALDVINHDVLSWDFGKNRWDLITMIYAGNEHAMIEKIKVGLKRGGLFVVEFFHKDATAGTGIGGFTTGELAKLFGDGWTIVKDEVVDDIADWGLAKTKVVRFTAQKK